MTQPRRLSDDCFRHDKDRLRHGQALAILQDRLQAVRETETVPLAQTRGRFLAQAVTAPRPVPAFDNPAVDGYAIAHKDLNTNQPTEFQVIGRAAAGHLFDGAHEPGGAIRIFTGAVMPEGTDTVVMQEDVSVAGDTITVPPGLKPGANCRKAGEDLAEGAIVLEPGIPLRPQDIAAAASTGIAELTCFRKLRLALISTGDELVNPGQALPVGGVYDANRFMLTALTALPFIEITDMGILPDAADQVQSTLRDAARSHDVIVTSGGASRGEEDHIVHAIDALGSLHLWQLAIKPGRPIAFGQIGDTVFLGLPGNPVAVLVCFLLYARPVLFALGGGNWPHPQRFSLPAGFETAHKKPDRREFLRGWLETDEKGHTVVQKYHSTGSGLISSLRQATGLIEIPEETTSIKAGELVSFIPFSAFGL